VPVRGELALRRLFTSRIGGTPNIRRYLIIDKIPVGHDLSPYLELLDVDATLVIVGAIGMMAGYSSFPLIAGRRRIAGSPSGGIAETQEMLDFCAKKNILPVCELIQIQEINEAFDRLGNGDKVK
jgi:alcohol dehydrogenase (NADP+)